MLFLIHNKYNFLDVLLSNVGNNFSKFNHYQVKKKRDFYANQAEYFTQKCLPLNPWSLKITVRRKFTMPPITVTGNFFCGHYD